MVTGCAGRHGDVQGDSSPCLGRLGVGAFPEALSSFLFLPLGPARLHGFASAGRRASQDRVNAMRSTGLGLGYLCPLGWPVERIPARGSWEQK